MKHHVAIANVFPFQQVTNTTHKYLGVEEAIKRHPDAEAFCVISSGNRFADLKRCLAKESLETPVYVLVNSPRGWENEIVMEGNRILRDARERAAYVSERTGIPPHGIVDVTDARSARLTNALREYIRDGKYTRVLTPVGSGGLYLSAVHAVERLGDDIKVIGVTPRGENGIFIDPETAYERRDGKLYFTRFDPSSIADKLPCPYTKYRRQLLEAHTRGHRIFEADEEQLKQAFTMAHMAFHTVEPSSAAGLVGLTPTGWREGLVKAGDKVLVLLTGTAAFEDEQTRDLTRRLLSAPDEFTYLMVNGYGDLDHYYGRWEGRELACALTRTYAPAQRFTVDIESLIATSELGERYDLRTQQVLPPLE